MIDKIKQYPANSKLALLLRHADRDRIPTGTFGNEVLLNEKGVANSLHFGSELIDYKINKIYTSPIQRCFQTAEFIADGYRKKIEIIPTKSLGDPGLHILDEKIAGNFFIKHGFDEMYERFISGIEIPGVLRAKEFRIEMSRFIKEHSRENGLTLFITHDMLIAFYHFSIDKTIYTKDNWVNYLSGLIIN
jgi:broad specificity phosphatase PhoE